MQAMYDALKDVWQELTAPGGAFEIEEINVRGAPMRTYKAAPRHLGEVWASTLVHGDKPYLVFENEVITYAEAHDMVTALRCWFSDIGLMQGDRVAIAMRNFPEYMPCYWATMASGLTVVGMNAWWVEDEMAYALEDSAPRVLICDEERLARFSNIHERFPHLKVVTVRCDGFEGSTRLDTALAMQGTPQDVSIDPDDDACIFYTSGTTGRPKGAQQTHRGCVHNIMNMAFWGQCLAHTNHRVHGTPLPDPATAPAPAALITTPLFHVTANNCVAQGTTMGGGKLVHMYKWDAGDALALIEREKITSMSGVPVMSRELISHPDFPNRDTSSLLSLGGGGAQLQPDLVGKIDQSVATARPGTGYGMTETCGIITSIGGDFFVDRPESCGPAMPSFEVQIVNSEGTVVTEGTGELWVRGAPVIKGYLNRADATAETITDGWLHTGDVARLDDDGFIYIVDRVKDMVLRGGENVYCSEVETVLFQIDAIAECSVFGVPDDRLGEEVGAAIYLHPGASSSADEIRAYCAGLMAKHKIPRYIWLLDNPLPRNANGKFLKRELREILSPDDAI
jgi:long-chain acyl-CoA synthetase